MDLHHLPPLLRCIDSNDLSPWLNNTPWYQWVGRVRNLTPRDETHNIPDTAIV
jgi:hypothetical protein